MKSPMNWLSFGRIAGLMALSGCGIFGMSEQKFVDQIVDAQCDFYEECLGMYFQEYFENTGECVEMFSDYIDLDYYEDCDYDKSAAKECLKAYQEIAKSCDYEEMYESYEACGDVWDCGTNTSGSTSYYYYYGGSGSY